MNRSKAVLAALTLGLATACAAPAPPPPPPPPDTTAADTAAINKLRDDYAAAFKAADAEKLGTLITEDEVSMGIDLPTTTGRAANVENLKGIFSQMTPTEFILTSDEMKLLGGGYAYDRGTSTATFTPTAKGAKPMTQTTRYLVILRRESDGSWKVARDMDNLMPAPPKPAK
jgi:uncharacterized protein (TIGR02246 family)